MTKRTATPAKSIGGVRITIGALNILRQIAFINKKKVVSLLDEASIDLAKKYKVQQ